MNTAPTRLPTASATTAHPNGNANADEVADDDGNGAREEGLAEERGRERTRDDGQHVDVGAEPEREQMTCLAVPLVERDLVDRVLFDLRRSFPAVQYRRIHDWKSLASMIGEEV